MIARKHLLSLMVCLGVAGCAIDFSLDTDPRTDSGTGHDTDTETQPNTDTETQPNRDTESGSEPSTDTDTSASTATDPVCDGNGALHQGICWYLGAYGQSCRQVCASHGDCHPSAAQYVGTPTQGGSAQECAAIAGTLGWPTAASTAAQIAGAGFGCHLWDNGTLYWLIEPAFDPESSTPAAKLVCGCQR